MIVRGTAGRIAGGFRISSLIEVEAAMGITRVVGTVALSFLCLVATAAAPRELAVAEKPVITVYKDPSCGCCKNWIEHLVKHRYRVTARDTRDLGSVKRTLGVPDRLQSCHTAVVGGYLIEGHVPADDIARLLTQKPKIRGLAVPGMPMGSPGMEGPTRQSFTVLAFDGAGKTQVFARH
jgi:hypothetical protein